jgi:hypothetical protein
MAHARRGRLARHSARRKRRLARPRLAATVGCAVLAVAVLAALQIDLSPRRETASGPTVATDLPLSPRVGARDAVLGPVVVPTPSPPRGGPRAVKVRPVRVPVRGTGRLVTVPGHGPVRGHGPLRRYIVEVEEGTGQRAEAFARSVERTLADPRSWAADGRLSFQRVDSGPVDFRVVLASPDRTDLLCAPLDTVGQYSCYQGERAVINLRRWLLGSPWYGTDLPAYRHYVVNHEVGHALGHGHLRCPGAGQVAPLMLPQTEGLDGCTANPWPYPPPLHTTPRGSWVVQP